MNRKGFSLIELLVSIAIMAVIVGALYSTLGATGGAARTASTKATIQKIDSIIQAQVEKINTRSMIHEGMAFAESYAMVASPLAYASPQPNTPVAITPKIAEVYLRKLEYRSTFPQRLEDLFGLDGAANTPDDAYLLTIWLSKTGGVLRPSGMRPEHESAKLLYLAMVASNSTLTDSINKRHIAYLDPPDSAMDLPAFVDDWGNALRFYNFPTRLVRPGGAGTGINQSVYDVTAKPLIGLSIPSSPSPIPPPSGFTLASPFNVNQDPTDPSVTLAMAMARGYFVNPFRLGRYTTTYKRFSGSTVIAPPPAMLTCAPVNEQTFHTLTTYHKPLIVSCGEDGQLGLEEPTAAGALRLAMPKSGKEEEISDNLTNLQGRN